MSSPSDLPLDTTAPQRSVQTRPRDLPIGVQLRRLPRLLTGLVLFGVGLGLFYLGNQGVPSWDVFHQGVARHVPLSVGTVIIIVSLSLLGMMALLHEPMGFGTLGGAVVIGLVIDLVLWVGSPADNWVTGSAMTIVGTILSAIGSAFYLGVRLGAGPRDGLMTALNRRGIQIWKARLVLEVLVLIIGIALGGTFGWGTVLFAVSMGPLVQWALTWLSTPLHASESAS